MQYRTRLRFLIWTVLTSLLAPSAPSAEAPKEMPPEQTVQPPAPPPTSPEEQALEHYQTAMTHYRVADYRAALPELRKALELHRHPNILYYAGESYRRLGKLRDAYLLYSEYASSLEPTAARAFLQRVDRELKYGPVAALMVSATPTGARVFVDGELRGRTPADGSPLAIEVSGGMHRVIIELGGYLLERHDVTVEFGEPQAVGVTLRSAAKSPPKVKVLPNVPGARVLIDGEKVCHGAVRLALAEGEHHVGVFKPGYNVYETRFYATPDRVTELRPRLSPVTFTPRVHGPLTVEGLSEASAGPRRPAHIFLYAIGGPTVMDVGHAGIDPTVGVEAGGRLGYLFRWQHVGLHFDTTVLYATVNDAASVGGAHHGGFLSLLGGGGARLYLQDDLFVGASVSLGTSLLLGSVNQGELYGAGLAPGEQRTTTALFAVRPELSIGFNPFDGLLLYASPVAVDFSPRAAHFDPRVSMIYRFHFALGVGYEF